MAYSYNNVNPALNTRLWKASCGTKLKTSSINVPLVGSEVGGVVVTCQDNVLTLRDMLTGVKIRDIKVDMEVEVMWTDGLKIVLISKKLENIGAVTILSFS